MQDGTSASGTDATQPDVAVLVEGDRVVTFSTILGLGSPVFAALLRTGMKEGLTREVCLPGKSKKDLELFLAFLHPLSRVRVSPDTVDRMLPWFDEYQVEVLKEECEEVLLGMACTSQRLLQARTFGLNRQYQRCLGELTITEFGEHFGELAREPQIVHDVLPSMEKQLPRLSLVSTAIRETLGTTRLASLVPLFTACVRHSGQLDEDIAQLLQELLEPCTTTAAAAKVLELLLLEKEQHKEQLRKELLRLSEQQHREFRQLREQQKKELLQLKQQWKARVTQNVNQAFSNCRFGTPGYTEVYTLQRLMETWL
mmetsp:Transcript_79989/g.226335  ORF Transcript_79989/g.226335 Transcript_79989/m.226335 type:complete len:313 (-) Transcript_79989:93-1031(-)